MSKSSKRLLCDGVRNDENTLYWTGYGPRFSFRHLLSRSSYGGSSRTYKTIEIENGICKRWGCDVMSIREIDKDSASDKAGL